MKRQSFLVAIAIAGLGLPAGAASVQTRRADIRGGGGDGGKCTIEVEVDDTAEVEVSGDQGRIQTLSGSPSVWRRFQCSSPMPRNPGDFRFSGIDGRGRVELIRDPRNNGGRAVVRIQDSQGGREGYTFDLEWRGNGGGYPEGGAYPGGGGGNRFPGGGGDGRLTAERAIEVCKDSVREQARRQYGVRDLDINRINADNNPGRNDWIVGEFDARGGRNRDRYSFACSVNFNNGRVRSVEVQRR